MGRLAVHVREVDQDDLQVIAMGMGFRGKQVAVAHTELTQASNT